MSRQSEDIRKFILENVEDHPGDITMITAEHFHISRQAAHKHVAHLVDEGLLIAAGSTRDRQYRPNPLVDFLVELPLENLQEDKAWRQHIRPLLDNVPANVLGICQYGFTEMVNNAIDHSEGTKVRISLFRTYKQLKLEVVDDGVGIFTKLQRVFELDDPLHAILELAKGKLTSDPSRHTGEGIFFSSRMFDRFFILSGTLAFAHTQEDVLIEDKKAFMDGTAIIMEIETNSARTTQGVFDSYSSVDDFGFSKTRVPVFLATYGDENLVSRSQAKRLLAHFEKFKEIVLDFANVNSIGQAFADEIFRVFRNQNPAITLNPINANSQVEKMIQRAVNNEMI